LDEQILFRIEVITGLAQSPVVFEEDPLGLEVSIQPTLYHVQVFGDEGVLAFLFFKGGGAGPGSTVVMAMIHGGSSGQGTKPDQAMVWWVALGYGMRAKGREGYEPKGDCAK
jgi:hypothetical protein